jgi:hypothetical protein
MANKLENQLPDELYKQFNFAAKIDKFPTIFEVHVSKLDRDPYEVVRRSFFDNS